MKITLNKLSKRYGSQWIFKDVDFEFLDQGKYAIVGSNGSGKSTLLRILIAKIPFTKGHIRYETNDGVQVNPEEIYSKISVATTSMSLIEEFNLLELVQFHIKFRKPIDGISSDEILEILELSDEKKKLVSNFSSGMKQRLKIGLAILTESEILVLDEPGANLDEAAKSWFLNLLHKYLNKRMLVIASNESSDLIMCDQELNLSKIN